MADRILRKASILPVLALFLLPQQYGAMAEDSVQVDAHGIERILALPLQPAPQGDAAADVTLVLYFDYDCPVCRQLDPQLSQLLHDDPHVRLVYKDWPIFGAVSAYAAYSTFAAENLGHFAAAHRALIDARHELDTFASVDNALREAGLDVAAIQAQIERHRSEFSARLTRNQIEAEALGLRGTPGLLVGDRLIAGAPQPQLLRLLIAQARGSKAALP